MDLSFLLGLSSIMAWVEVVTLFVGGYFSYLVFKKHPNQLSWLVMGIGLILLGLGEFLNFAVSYQFVSPDLAVATLVFSQLFVPFIASAVVLYGMLGFKDMLNSPGSIPSTQGTKARRRKR